MLGVIDSGIDRSSTEFAGRLSSASRDFGGSGTVEAEDGHGTAVSAVALGGKNDFETHGIAFDATLLALRADTAGTCASEDPDDPDSGCSFDPSNIAAAVDYARTSGAKVINISLGGGGVSNSLRNAITRAASAGIIVVVSAGNDGDSTEDGIDPDNPDPFAQGIADTGTGLVIIAGSVGTAGSSTAISTFSNRAGTYQNVYLAALGYRVRAPDQNGDIYLWSGTSFSAPQISGAAALLLQAFPTLTGAQVVDILLRSAADAGDAGTDAIYGRGILDIARAFQPIGTTALAGSTEALDFAVDTAALSGAMGDAMAVTRTDAVILDEYARAFALDLAQTVRIARPDMKLVPALSAGPRQISMASPTLAVSLSVAPGSSDIIYGAQTLMPDAAEQARVLAASVMARLSPDTDVAFAIRRGSDGLSAALEGRREAAFLVGESARGQTGFGLKPSTGMALRHHLGDGFAVTARAETGLASVRETDPFRQLREPAAEYRYNVVGTAFDKVLGAARLSLAADMMSEKDTVLGARFGSVYGGGGATSLFVDAGARFDLGRGWDVGGQWRQGWTWATPGGRIEAGSLLKSSAWSLDAGKLGVLGARDSFALRVSQPLRVSSGGLALNLPIGYDYATLATEYGVRNLNLAPNGREIDVEGVYGVPLSAGRLTTNVYYRRQAGNIAAMPDDIGGAIRFTLGF